MPAVEKFVITGEATATCGRRRMASMFLIGMGAPLTPFMMLALEGRIIRSAPMPLVRCFWSFSMPMKMPTMDRIMMTSMATASTLMMERTGR